ncbi:RNA polymerase-binding protein DksA [Leucothrix pacifica]|uniref:RNA polymerase-binding transcription factor DksA n=1 Tax=Leucothrix pacifica TaxID=1247513 RepID=A0A317CGJ5_9GAMM|nr:RNA polymerase-binding protein DksA [Leucothrix pacifica]PWQ97694.1 RNA polymerase-binding protein DksA [Leucothrix pacifica]
MTAQITRKSALPVDGVEPYVSAPDEEYMNQAQLDHFRNILVKWRESLQVEVDRTVDHMQEDASNFSDPADRATQEEEFTLELRARDRERKLIRKIEKTIVRVDADDYGFCDACGIEIGLQRLEVRPTAELCIDCKSTQEIKERQLAN